MESPSLGRPADTRELVDKIEQLFNRLSNVDHYELLGVGRDASVPIIQRALGLRRLLLRSHLFEANPRAHTLLDAMEVAWEVLGDPGRRALYDRRLRGQLHTPSPAASRATPAPEPFSRSERAQEVFSVPARAPSIPPPPMPPNIRPTRAPTPEPIAPSRAPVAVAQRRSTPPPAFIRGPLASMPVAPHTPRVPSDVGPPRDAHEGALRELYDDVDALCAALQSTLAALTSLRPHDDSLEAAALLVGRVQSRHAARRRASGVTR